MKVAKSPVTQHVTCSIAKSASRTVKAMIQGDVTVGFASLSASVGYDVQRSTTITTSSTADVPKHTAGVVQWAAVFNDRKQVIQNYYKCPKNRKPTVQNCSAISANPRYIAVATTEKYDAPSFRFKKKR